MPTKTFQGTNSQKVVEYLQSRYGSANYANLQVLRCMFYSYITYPLAGSSVLNFFGDAVGSSTGAATITLQDTNLPKAGSFGQVHFLLKEISLRFRIGDMTLTQWANTGLDAATLVSDFVNGFVQAGMFSLDIQSRNFIQLPLPFQYLAKFGGNPKLVTAGLEGITLTEGTPNTFLTNCSSQPSANLSNRMKGAYRVDPNILIEAEQNFSATINFPSGLVPVIATGVATSSNLVKVGMVFDGLVFRPMQ